MYRMPDPLHFKEDVVARLDQERHAIDLDAEHLERFGMIIQVKRHGDLEPLFVEPGRPTAILRDR